MHLQRIDMLPVLLVLAVIHLVSANYTTGGPFMNLMEQRKQVLCTVGCKCPEAGQVMTFLDCSQKGISQLPFSLLINSSVTSISFKNNHLVTLKMNTFFRAEEVQDLDFSQNSITKIENYTFAPFMSLTHLRLSHNRLSHVTPGLLNGLWNLRILELGHNLIQTLSYQTFEVTPNLQELRLQYNQLFDLPENTFKYLPRLEKLDLEDNGLVLLHSNIFRPTPRLHSLSLERNAFEQVPREALSQAPQLGILNVSENDFTILVEGTFRGMTNLSALYLNGMNSLIRIEKDAFAGLEKLKTLFCNYNSKLSYIDKDVFGSETAKTFPKEKLSLRGNALKTLQSPLEAQAWASLSFVDLKENPWKCDCNLLWMTQLTKETQAQIKCDSPRHLRGRSFDTLDPYELRCEDTWPVATLALVLACIVAFGAVMMAASSIVCSRTPIGLYVRAKKQFSYNKVKPEEKKPETVDLEWDPTAEI